MAEIMLQPLTWSTTPPKADGWYWCRNTACTFICRIDDGSADVLGQVIPLRELKDWFWSGPIAPPLDSVTVQGREYVREPKPTLKVTWHPELPPDKQFQLNNDADGNIVFEPPAIVENRE